MFMVLESQDIFLNFYFVLWDKPVQVSGEVWSSAYLQHVCLLEAMRHLQEGFRKTVYLFIYPHKVIERAAYMGNKNKGRR